MKHSIALHAFQIELEKQLQITLSIENVIERNGTISFLVVSDAFTKMSFRKRIQAIKLAKASAAVHCDKMFWPNCMTVADFAKTETIENAIRSFESSRSRASA